MFEWSTPSSKPLEYSNKSVGTQVSVSSATMAWGLLFGSGTVPMGLTVPALEKEEGDLEYEWQLMFLGTYHAYASTGLISIERRIL